MHAVPVYTDRGNRLSKNISHFIRICFGQDHLQFFGSEGQSSDEISKPDPKSTHNLEHETIEMSEPESDLSHASWSDVACSDNSESGISQDSENVVENLYSEEVDNDDDDDYEVFEDYSERCSSHELHASQWEENDGWGVGNRSARQRKLSSSRNQTQARVGTCADHGAWKWGSGFKGKSGGRQGANGRVEPVQIRDGRRLRVVLWDEQPLREKARPQREKARPQTIQVEHKKRAPRSIADLLAMSFEIEGKVGAPENAVAAKTEAREQFKPRRVFANRKVKQAEDILEVKKEQWARNKDRRWKLFNLQIAVRNSNNAGSNHDSALPKFRDEARAARALGLDLATYRAVQELQWQDDRALVNNYDLLYQVHETANQRKTLDQRRIAQLPSEKYASDDDIECAVCLNPLKRGQSSCRLPCAARHTFHESCIRNWLAKGGACCPLDQEDISKALAQHPSSCVSTSHHQSPTHASSRTRTRKDEQEARQELDEQAQLQLAIQMSVEEAAASERRGRDQNGAALSHVGREETQQRATLTTLKEEDSDTSDESFSNLFGSDSDDDDDDDDKHRAAQAQDPRPVHSDPIIAEQHAAYEASLRVDQEREEVEARREEEEKRLEEEEREREQAAEAREALLKARKEQLAPEPPASASDTVTIKLRLPDGTTRTRRCFKSSRCQLILDVLASEGFEVEAFRLVDPCSRSEIDVMSAASESLQSLGIEADTAFAVEDRF